VCIIDESSKAFRKLEPSTKANNLYTLWKTTGSMKKLSGITETP
jgi:hypothetical protein